MAHSFTALQIHAIFSTKNRSRILTADARERLFPFMGGVVRDMKGSALIVNGVEDHVHVLATLPATLSVSDFMRELKAVSSLWARDHLSVGGQFGWQTGYAAFSVSKSISETVRQYIARQGEHHRNKTFEEEYLAYLKAHEIEYDPRFVFEQEIVG